MKKMAMAPIPATKVLAKVIQLYKVEAQSALMLISHNQGTVDMTVRANHTINNEAHTVFLKIYFLPASISGNGLLSSSRDILRICLPRKLHNPIVSIVHTKKKVGLRNPLLPFNSSLLLTA